VRSQRLARFTVEQGGALVAELGPLELDPEDLARRREDAADPQVGRAVHDLVAQRLHDAAYAALAARARIEERLKGACAAHELVAARGSHGAPSIPRARARRQGPRRLQPAAPR